MAERARLHPGDDVVDKPFCRFVDFRRRRYTDFKLVAEVCARQFGPAGFSATLGRAGLRAVSIRKLFRAL
jgi:hypothetical protein